MIKISVVTTLYNYSKFISDLINSVLVQTIPDWELIIIDDASTDNPQKVIEKYLNDERIKYYRLDKNYGYSKAKNEGILKSSGEYLVLIDADDMLTNISLNSRVNFLLSHPQYKWVHAKAYEFGVCKPYNFTYKKRKFIKTFEKMKKTGNYKGLWSCIHAQTVMTKREIYESVGLYDENLLSMSDKEMWARIQNHIGIPGYLKEFVAYYRIHEKQMHRNPKKVKNLDKLKKNLNNLIAKRKKNVLDGIRKIK